MKTCECGGTLYRHGKAVWHKRMKVEGNRYRCKDCGKCITVREGEVMTPVIGGKLIKDWRHEMGAGKDQRSAAA